MDAKKISDEWLEITHKQRVSKEDLLSEKETLENKLIIVNERLELLK